VYKTDKPNIDLERFEAVEKQLNGHGLVAPLVVLGGTGLPKPIVNKLVALRAGQIQRVDGIKTCPAGYDGPVPRGSPE
jgi:fructose/tagatose bisphosphate aldolase